MRPREYLEVDPSKLRLPPTRADGADLVKLQRQFSRFGVSTEGIPPLEVKRGTDGELVIFDGVTRATRVARYLPGRTVTVEVTGDLPAPVGGLPSVGDKL